MNRVFKIMVMIFAVIVIIFSAMFGVLAAHKASEISFGNNIDVEGLENTEEKDIGMVNMLLIGVDDGGFRSDTIMLASIDGYSKRVNLLSIPRDLMITVSGRSPQKINSLIGLGQERAKEGKVKEPEEVLIDAVKEITGLPIHYFASVDFDGFKDIINAVDGVDFNVPYNMDYDDPVQNLHIHLKAGQQHLDGQKAHDFVRFRHNNNGTAPGEYVMGDEGREFWQQEFIKEFLKQKCNPKYISKLDDLFKVVKDNVRTNYTMKDLLNHLSLVQTVNINEVGTYELPGESAYIDSLWWYLCDKKKTQQLMKDVFLPKSAAEWEEYKQKNGNDNRLGTQIAEEMKAAEAAKAEKAAKTGAATGSGAKANTDTEVKIKMDD